MVKKMFCMLIVDVELVEEAVVTEVGVGAAWPPPGAEHLQLSMTLLTHDNNENGEFYLI